MTTRTRPPVAFARVRPSALATEAGAPCGLLAGQLVKVLGMDPVELSVRAPVARLRDDLEASGEPMLYPAREVEVVTETHCRGWVRVADLDVVTLAQVRERGWAALDADAWGTAHVRELLLLLAALAAVVAAFTAGLLWWAL